jgi:hypothetical protein
MRAGYGRIAGALTVAALMGAGASMVAAQRSHPANATAECKDGSYSEAKSERGACSGHGGVGTWYGAAKSDAKAAPAKDTGKTATAAAKMPASATKGTAVTNSPAAASTSAKTAAAPPADTTGQCKDGTYTKAKSQRGACAGHGGVATWTAAAPTPSQAVAPPPAATANPPAATANPPARATAPANTTPRLTTGSSNIQAPPAGAPANATGQGNDGTFTMATQHRGACSGHKGVKAWFK